MGKSASHMVCLRRRGERRRPCFEGYKFDTVRRDRQLRSGRGCAELASWHSMWPICDFYYRHGCCQPYTVDIGECDNIDNVIIPLRAHSFCPWLNRRAHVVLSLTWPNPGLGSNPSLNSSTVDHELPTGDNVPRCSGTAQPDMLAPRRSESSRWVE
jgi:hypothetical protein